MIEWILEDNFILLSWMNPYLESPCIGDQFYADFFQQAFTRYRGHKKALPQEDRIPKILHFIWMGKKKFPSKSVKNLKSWRDLHPDWKIIFWTDSHSPPLPEMEVRIIEPPGELSPYFNIATNPAERADYLRYHILYECGGIYADHDVTCLKSFEEISDESSFFSIQSHAFSNEFFYRFGKRELFARFLMDNGILGSKPGCKLWNHVFKATHDTWDFYTKKWGHFEPLCILHRSLLPLTIGIIEYLHETKDPTICPLPKICQYPHAFSSPFFKPVLEKWAYCQNKHAKTWITKEERKELNDIWKASL